MSSVKKPDYETEIITCTKAIDDAIYCAELEGLFVSEEFKTRLYTAAKHEIIPFDDLRAEMIKLQLGNENNEVPS